MRSPPTIGQINRPHIYREDGSRKSPTEKGYGWRWTCYRKSHLRLNPLCRDCQDVGKVTPAQEIHHILKAADHPELFWEPTNHLGLCKKCHSIRTALGQ